MTENRKPVLAPGTADAACHDHAHRVQEGSETAPRTLQLDSTITCPECGSATRVRMPTDACQFFWECPACDTLLRPKRGDCCVFCSWGDVPCPPVQENRDCCG